MGGTSDYASEMIHCCSTVACLDTTLPFMADALGEPLRLARRATGVAVATTYNVGAFSRSAAEIRQVVLADFRGR